MIAVVTGAGSGIGRAVAQALGREGYSLVLAGRRAETLAETASGCPDSITVETDVTRPASVEHLFQEAVRVYGRVDVLFNNAGAFPTVAPVDEVAVEDWERVLATNLTGCFLCAQAAFRVMRSQSPTGGRIINNGSVSAHVPRPNAIAYTASKHGVTGLTKALSLEGRDVGIACGQIDIGNVRTDLSSDVVTAGGEASIDAAPVADAVVYMAGLPLEANVQFMTVMATRMPFIGRG